MDGRDKKLLELPYIEIKEVQMKRHGELYRFVNSFVSFSPLLNILIEFCYFIFIVKAI